MKFTVVNIGTNNNATGATIAVTVPAGGVPANAAVFVVITEKSTSGTSGSVADTQSNSYSSVTAGNLNNAAASGRGMIFSSQAVTPLVSGNTITYTRNLSGSNCAISAFYVTGAVPSGTLTEALATATGSTGTITVTSGTPAHSADLFIGVLCDGGTSVAGGNATFTQAAGFVTPPVESTGAGNGNARVDGGFKFNAGTATVTYNPTMSSTAQVWFMAVFGILAAPDAEEFLDLPPLGVIPPYPVQLRTLTVNILQGPITAPVRPSTVFRPPTYTNPLGAIPQYWQYGWTQDLLESTLAPPPPVPPSTVFRPVTYLNPRGPEHHVQLRFWSSPPPPAVPGLPPGENIFDLPIGQRFGDQIQLHAWTWNYNRNLIGQDKFPPGEDVFDLTPLRTEPNPRRSWEYSYNRNLIGKDVLPFNQKDWPNPQPVRWYQDWRIWLNELELEVPFNQLYWPNPYPVQWYQSWERSYVLSLIGQDKLPNRQQDWLLPQPVQWYQNWAIWQLGELELEVPFKQLDWPNPTPVTWYRDWFQTPPRGVVQVPFNQFYWPNPYPTQWYQTWEWAYNRNLIGKDQLPTLQRDFPNPLPVQWYQHWAIWQLGELELEVPFKQLYWPNPFPVQWYQSWERAYTLSLIGQDKVPGKIYTDLTGIPAEPNPKRSWEYWYNLNLIGQDRFPNRQEDWPLPYPVQWYREWNWKYNQNLIGQDQLPTLQRDWPNPQPVYWYRDWSQNLRQLPFLFAKPFFQTDWPLPYPVQWYRDWYWSYNQNLIGQDQLPNRQQDWPNPRPVQWYQNWALWLLEEELAVPFKQLDWPNPPRVNWYQTWASWLNELELAVPFRQLDWPLPYPVQWYKSWEQWYDLNLIGKDILPFNQFYWPIPISQRSNDYGYVIFFPPPPAQAVPFNQFDWPLPQAYQRLVDYFWAQTPQVPVVFLPFNQYDWPNPKTFQRLVDYFISQSPFPPPAVVVVTDLHFKPHLISMGRMGNLGGVS